MIVNIFVAGSEKEAIKLALLQDSLSMRLKICAKLPTKFQRFLLFYSSILFMVFWKEKRLSI